MGRKYYSQRKGNATTTGLDLDDCKSLFNDIYEELNVDGYFEEYFGGFECVDSDEPTIGKLGRKPEVAITLDLKKGKLYPIASHLVDFSEDDLFDIIEYLYDHISKPVETENTYFHSYNNCGFHYDTFDQAEGRKVLTEKINRLLESYGEGFELNEQGEVILKQTDETSRLIKHNLPASTPSNVKELVEAAKNKFLRSRSSLDGRRDAIRDLADVFENLKSSGLLTLNKKDESDIFNIANNFGIRHFDTKQKTDYDESIWLSWMFHFYLATIHACLRLQEKSNAAKSAGTTSSKGKV